MLGENHDLPRGERKLPVPVGTAESFEPLLDTDHAAKLLEMHPKALRQSVRRGEP